MYPGITNVPPRSLLYQCHIPLNRSLIGPDAIAFLSALYLILHLVDIFFYSWGVTRIPRGVDKYN